MTIRRLACPSGCGGDRFEALNAPLHVDASGAYVSHDASAATYVCAVCGSVAIDVGAAAREMHQEGEPPPATLACPACGTEMLPPEDDPMATLVECPVCDHRFSVEEGAPRLLGGSVEPSAGSSTDIWGFGEG